MAQWTVYDGIEAYARRSLLAYYQASKTAIFNNPQNQILTPKGKETLVREVESGGAGTYNKSKGWMTQYGQGSGVKWVKYKAEFDRSKVMTVDAVDEAQSFANGMTPSIELLATDFMDNQISREVDATTIAKFYSRLGSGNKFESSAATGYQTDAAHILDTLNLLDKDIFDSGYSGDTVLFMRSDVYANFISAIQAKMGLASNVLMEKTATVYLDTGMDKLIKDKDTAIKVNITFEQYGHFLIVRMPEDRMYTNVTLLSGDQDDEGQEAGGYVADTKAEGFANIDLLAVPISAGFTNVRYQVENYLVPAYMASLGKTMNIDLRALNERMFGPVEIFNAGINQKAAAFEIDTRVLYGADLFEIRRKNCFAVITTPTNP